MARIFIDGFESGGYDMWDASSNASVVSSAGLDMDGDYCLDLNTVNAGYVTENISAAAEMYFAFLYRPTGTSYYDIFTLYHDASYICHLIYQTTTLRCYAASYNTNGSTQLTPNTTYLIEVYFKMADSGGRAVIKIDGIIDIDYTGDTKPYSSVSFNKVKLGYGGNDSDAYFDNFRMDDAHWIGGTKIQKILPISAGNSTNWTPSAGANYECVDERPPSDADYVSINANDQVDTYVAGSMIGSIASVNCVQVQSRIESDGAPTPTNLKLVARSGGADYFSGDKSVPVDPKSVYHLWENNPADSQAWEESDINAMEPGIKSAA